MENQKAVSHFPTVPRKSPKARFPHSHRPDGGGPFIKEKRTHKNAPFGRKTKIKERRKFNATTYVKAPLFQAHPVLE